jgi:hypothetical protein
LIVRVSRVSDRNARRQLRECIVADVMSACGGSLKAMWPLMPIPPKHRIDAAAAVDQLLDRAAVGRVGEERFSGFGASSGLSRS